MTGSLLPCLAREVEVVVVELEVEREFEGIT
jgi:hypothetical protein